MLEVAGNTAASCGSSSQLWQWKACTGKSAKCSAKKRRAAANDASTSAAGQRAGPRDVGREHPARAPVRGAAG